jgi:hypothetical protein
MPDSPTHWSQLDTIFLSHGGWTLNIAQLHNPGARQYEGELVIAHGQLQIQAAVHGEERSPNSWLPMAIAWTPKAFWKVAASVPLYTTSLDGQHGIKGIVGCLQDSKPRNGSTGWTNSPNCGLPSDIQQNHACHPHQVGPRWPGCTQGLNAFAKQGNGVEASMEHPPDSSKELVTGIQHDHLA